MNSAPHTDQPEGSAVEPAAQLAAYIATVSAADQMEPLAEREQLLLWPGSAPGSEEWTHQEQAFRDPHSGGHRIRNVVVPTLTPYLPDPEAATGAAMIVAPGGGFLLLAMDYEGTDAAAWLAARGIAAFVLKYRLIDSGPEQSDFAEHLADLFTRLQKGAGQGQSAVDISAGVPALALSDTNRAFALLRDQAERWHIDPERIGILGFSAGAYLACNSVRSEVPSERPDFVAAIYGGYAPVPVPRHAPPLFTAVAADDGICFQDTVRAVQSWQAAARPVEAHIYADGGHGFGFNETGRSADSWRDRLEDWLRRLGHVTDESCSPHPGTRRPAQASEV